MPPSNHRKSTNPNPTRAQLVERNIRGCEPCKRRKRACNGQKPCAHCTDASQECVYSVVSDHPRSVFSTSTARRLSSGSACETCRRRKTKCDGQSPCGFCATNGIECVNNSERRKRVTSSSSLSTSTTVNEDGTIDRIEDRLRRIEKLMTAFSPVVAHQDIPRTTAFRKLSSPLLHQKSSIIPPRQQRHSIHTVSSPNEKAYITPPNSHGSNHSFADTKTTALSPPLSPPTSTNMVAASMLNLSLSPSSSSTSASSYAQSNEQQSVHKEWRSNPIPSLVDQLSKCTFVTTAVDFASVQYPIYPITLPSSPAPNSPSNE